MEVAYTLATRLGTPLSLMARQMGWREFRSYLEFYRRQLAREREAQNAANHEARAQAAAHSAIRGGPRRW